MKRWVGPLACALLALSCTRAPSNEPATESAAPPPTRPNVLLYLIDTLRADRVGTYGYPRPTTPTLDALAAEGVVFEQAYAPGPWTLPSVVSLMLSQPMCRHGVEVDGVRIDAQATPLAEVMRRNGYATASFIANTYAGRLSGLERGFDTYRGPVDDAGQLVGDFLDESGDEPFFIYVHDVRPHDPYQASRESLAPFGDVDSKTRKKMRNRSLKYRQLTRTDFANGTPVGSTDNTREQRVALARLDQIRDAYGVAYDARVREADEHVARTLEELDERGRLDDTLIIVLSDHGEELGEHGGWLHDQSVYDELVRAPLVVRLPQGEHGGERIETIVSLLDVAPTIADLAGVAVPEDAFEGRSLAPLLAGTTAARDTARDTPLVTSMRRNHKKYYRPWKKTRGDQNLVVRDGPWKAIWNVEPNTVELYDLSADPGERRNLSREHPAIAQRLAAHARAYLARCQERRGQPQPTTAELSEEAAERLRALGYVD